MQMKPNCSAPGRYLSTVKNGDKDQGSTRG